MWEVNRMELTRKSPRTETGTRTFSKGRVVLADDGTEIAVTVMSITTLSGFQKEHTEELLSQFAQTSRAFYLEAGDALKTEP